MSFKTLTTIFIALSIASVFGVAALLMNIRLPPLALLCLTFLNSAAFSGMVLTYRDADIQPWLRAAAFVGILAFTALANALQAFYGWFALAVGGLPFLAAVLIRYVIQRR